MSDRAQRADAGDDGDALSDFHPESEMWPASQTRTGRRIRIVPLALGEEPPAVAEAPSAVLNGCPEPAPFAAQRATHRLRIIAAVRSARLALASHATRLGSIFRSFPQFSHHVAFPRLSARTVCVVGGGITVGLLSSNWFGTVNREVPQSVSRGERQHVLMDAATVAAAVERSHEVSTVDPAVQQPDVRGEKQKAITLATIERSVASSRDTVRGTTLSKQSAPIDSGRPSARPPVSAAVPAVRGYRGALSVSSEPTGASVFINDQDVGRTPLVLTSLPVGSRAVRVVLPGYATWSRAVAVVADQSTVVLARLNGPQ